MYGACVWGFALILLASFLIGWVIFGVWLHVVVNNPVWQTVLGFLILGVLIGARFLYLVACSDKPEVQPPALEIQASTTAPTNLVVAELAAPPISPANQETFWPYQQTCSNPDPPHLCNESYHQINLNEIRPQT